MAATLDDAIDRAAAIFAQLCPDDPFLPAAPNPEDLVFESDPVYVSLVTVHVAILSYDSMHVCCNTFIGRVAGLNR
jgi:hypothetical protein